MDLRRLSYVFSVLMFFNFAATRTAISASAHAVAKRAEASMMVVGTVTVAPDGSVSGYQLEDAAALPPAVNALLQQAIPSWQFDPISLNGKPVSVKSSMSLRVVLHSLGDKRYRLYLAGASFSADGKPMKYGTSKRMQPRYPLQAIRERVSGTVYLALKIDPQGHVVDAMVEQVNLRLAGNDNEMERYRRMLANPALKAARTWVLDPQSLDGSTADHYAIVPVNYRLDDSPGGPSTLHGPGHWDLYIPGPRHVVPWFDAVRMVAGSGDALPDGGVYLFNPAGLHLRSKLGGA